MSLPKINLVVVGHKDHGKSTLIGRLLYDSNAIPEQKLQEIKDELKAGGKEFEFAFILDSLEEERTGGLTIDIMQTPFKSKKYFYTIIDCPGHREFIQKMLTGASQADAAILVVSAKEGIEDQTKQHLFLVKTLGVKQLIVAVNKLDIIGYDKETFETFSDKIRAILSSLDYSNVPLVPVSAFEGDNVTKPSERMKWYKGKTLIESLDSTVKPPKPLSKKPLRCVVQDIYEIEGRKIAVCRIETGTLKTGQLVAVMPVAENGTVDRIEAFGSVVKKATPGDSIGVLLHVARQLKRGYVLTESEEKLKPVKTFIAQLIVFADTKLSVGNKVSLRIGTAEASCKVDTILEKIDPVKLTVEETKPKSIRNGEVGKVLFRPLEPLYLEEYSEFPQLGRFVIIGKKGATAAGIVLDKR
jgi:elongation factor 1-alpha